MKEYSDTANRILDATQDLIQRRGYNAISFTDIAAVVGIKKPSILHHFSSKAELGKALVKRYSEGFLGLLNDASNDPQKTSLDAFDVYCSPYREFSCTTDKICLCGALAGEFMALPDDVKEQVSDFFGQHVKWLTMIFEQGKNKGELHFSDAADILARFIVNSLQGALIVKRASGQQVDINHTIALLKTKLTQP
jgi:TetR/AcrR family transcriptional repressor of nem operon